MGRDGEGRQLDWAYPALRSPPATIADEHLAVPDRRSTVSPGMIDLLGILSASQALSSETSIDRLHARVVDVLRGMTAATGVHLVLWSDERQSWLLPATGEHGVAIAGDDAELPLSVLRYVQRTREPLLVGDATGDDRFALDPYYSGVDMCSLLGVPIVSRGELGAVLLLENRLVRGAFSRGRFESVRLIAGQLAVSLDNARVNAEYRRIADEQSALRRVAVLATRTVAPDELFATVAEEVGTVLGADFALLSRYSADRHVECLGDWAADGPASFVGQRFALGGDDVSTLVFETGAPARVGHPGDTSRQFGARAAIGAPITVAGRRWGVMIVGATDEKRLPPGTEHRLAAFTELVATAVANAQGRAELEASRARLVTEADAARRRVVRDLHDGAQQRLIHTALTLGLTERALERGEPDAPALLSEATGHLLRAIEELRELSHGILPADLTRGGLRSAVDAVVERMEIPVAIDLPAERLPVEVEASAYFIVAEALTNIVKHAHAETAEVRAAVEEGTLRLQVRDDGTAAPTRRATGSSGCAIASPRSAGSSASRPRTAAARSSPPRCRSPARAAPTPADAQITQPV